MFGHMGVHSRQRVVQQVNVGVAVQSSGQAHPLPLATGEVDALSDGDTSPGSIPAGKGLVIQTKASYARTGSDDQRWK